MEKTKKEIVIIGLILLMIIALIGVSYAAFRFTGEGTKVNTITTGSITMTYTETDNTISLNGALPTTDATGKKRLNDGEYFDFTVSSKISGDVNINYEISAKDVTSSDGKKIDGKYIKLYLTRLTDDGEEELMTPETYNEETSSNSFTGRPSGEMSLYTSSMNSSESNNYRLRMWVDEDYNPQGDGGNLTFSVQINVYGKYGDKSKTSVETLLEKVNPEDLDYNSATSEQQKEMWTFSHPVTEQTEALTDYRYIGADPNNYVTFNDELWRIIGVFTVDDGTGRKEERLKIIRDDRSIRQKWDSNNTNDWLNATLNAYLNSGDYWINSLGEEARNMIGDTLWYLGGESSTTALVSNFYLDERSTTVYSGRSVSWIGKVGLMYVSDYGYATGGGMAADRTSCLNEAISNWDSNEFSDCINNDWLTSSANEWTLTPGTNSYYVYFLRRTSSINRNRTYNNYYVRPVVYLKYDIKIVEGDGSATNPYILQG